MNPLPSAGDGDGGSGGGGGVVLVGPSMDVLDNGEIQRNVIGDLSSKW